MFRGTCAVAAILCAALAATSAGAADRAVTSQGLIARVGGTARTSPLGTTSVDVVFTVGADGRPEVSTVATTSDGTVSELGKVPGAAVLVSDVGRVVAIEPSETPAIPALIRIIELDGRVVGTVRARGLTDPALSPCGTRLAYGTTDAVAVLDLATLEVTNYPRFAVFAAGPAGLAAGWIPDRPTRGGSTGRTGELVVFEGATRLASVPIDARPVRIRFTSDGSTVLVLTASALTRVDVGRHRPETIFEAPSGGRLRDLALEDGTILIGFRTVERGRATGWIASGMDDGGPFAVERGPSTAIPRGPTRPRTSRGIPWPIAPNMQHPVGNTYGEYQNYGGGGYLHPGVDVLGSPGQAVHAVRGGVVKAVLTTGGEFHWRVAVADSATSGTSEGYLYAHLNQLSIAVDVGEVVERGQYLGDLVEWPIYGFTHVHFARIEDEGVEWYGEWLSTENPHLDFENQSDFTAPVFEPARGSDLLAFCVNQTSVYRDPWSLSGVVDIVAHVGDAIESSWVCTVQEIRYTIYPVGHPESPVVDDRRALFCDMVLDTYVGGPIDPFLVGLLYKRDGTCFTQGDYDFREFYHIITNSDGDQIYEESDLLEGWDTTGLPDADYVVRVVASDVAGNATADSMVVTTANGNAAWTPDSDAVELALRPCHPNPAPGGASIVFTMPARSAVRVSIYDPAGRMVRRIADTAFGPGSHELEWDGRDSRGAAVAAGVYLVRLETPDEAREGKLIVIR